MKMMNEHSNYKKYKTLLTNNILTSNYENVVYVNNKIINVTRKIDKVRFNIGDCVFFNGFNYTIKSFHITLNLNIFAIFNKNSNNYNIPENINNITLILNDIIQKNTINLKKKQIWKNQLMKN